MCLADDRLDQQTSFGRSMSSRDSGACSGRRGSGLHGHGRSHGLFQGVDRGERLERAPDARFRFPSPLRLQLS